MTRDGLEVAMRDVIGDDEVVDAMLRSTSLPSVLRYAGEKAFLDQIEGESTEVVREALLMLRSPGYFTFED